MNEAITELLHAIAGGMPATAIIAAVYLTVVVARRVSPATWSKLPSWAQPIVPVALAGLGAVIESVRSGLPMVESLALGVQAGTAAIALHHTVKRIKPSTAAVKTSAASIVLLLTGCGLLGVDPATARDAYVDCVSERVEPEIRALLARAASECPPDGRCPALESAALIRLEQIAIECGHDAVNP